MSKDLGGERKHDEMNTHKPSICMTPTQLDLYMYQYIYIFARDSGRGWKFQLTQGESRSSYILSSLPPLPSQAPVARGRQRRHGVCDVCSPTPPCTRHVRQPPGVAFFRSSESTSHASPSSAILSAILRPPFVSCRTWLSVRFRDEFPTP